MSGRVDPASSAIGLDPSWLSARLAERFGAPGPTAAFEGFVGTGQMSRTARFRLAWGEGQGVGTGQGPSSVVVKVPSADAGTRSVSFEHGLYRRECAFYREVGALVEVTAPEAYHVHFDDDSLDFALVLEDLAGWSAGDHFTEPTDAQLEAAVEQAAALHAPLWGKLDHPALGLYREDPAERAVRTEQRVRGFLPVVLERLGSRLETETVEVLHRFAERSAAWSLATPQLSLVHGDFRPDNFLYAPEPPGSLGSVGSARSLTVVDWQTLGVGAGVTDVAYLLGGSLSAERRRSVETDLLALYRQHLIGRGVVYGEEQCQQDYARATAYGMVVAISATVLAERTDRGDDLFALMLNRHAHHARNLG